MDRTRIINSNPKTLNELIEELHRIFEDDKINTEEVRAVMSAYNSNSKEWKKFAKFDPHRYTRNLVDTGNGKFNLMILAWGESHGSGIHSHANSHCFMKILDGSLRETLFEWPTEEGQELVMKEQNIYKRNEITYINDSIGLHRVENPSHTDPAVSLHLYCPPFDACETFDQRTGHKTVCQVTFWSKFGERTPFTTNSCALITSLKN